MAFTYFRRALIAATLLAAAGCTVKNSEPPPLSGPSGLALTLTLNAIPDSISQDGGSQSSIKVTAVGPDGKALAAVPIRVDMMVNGVAQDYGTLSARSIVTNSEGVATVVYTAPPSPPNGVFGTCVSLPGNCVSIVATATSTSFDTANPQQVQIRLVPTGVILPPASAPTAVFAFSPTSVTANLPIQFDASGSCGGAIQGGACSSASAITAYSWNFGDGTSGSGKNVTHTFSAGNNFTVTLTVTNDRGLTASSTQTLGVGAPALPTPLFTFSPDAPGVNEAVFFNASTSTPGTGHSSIASYRWSFGDGQTGSGITVSHQFATAGNYLVQLTVTDEAGQSNTSTGTTITVGNPPAPTAAFTFSPALPSINQAVTFDASTSTPAVGPGGQPIVSYTWTFGDNTAPQTTSSPTFSHTYGVAGTYAVILVVRDSAGRTNASLATTVTVAGTITCSGATLCASINVSKSPVPVNEEVSFTAIISPASMTITNYQWDFGDGTQQFSGPNVVGYTYRRTGTFTVKLTVTNSNGAIASATLTVLVQ